MLKHTIDCTSIFVVGRGFSVIFCNRDKEKLYKMYDLHIKLSYKMRQNNVPEMILRLKESSVLFD